MTLAKRQSRFGGGGRGVPSLFSFRLTCVTSQHYLSVWYVWYLRGVCHWLSAEGGEKWPLYPPFISPVAFQEHVIWDPVSTEWIKLYYKAALKEN